MPGPHLPPESSQIKCKTGDQKYWGHTTYNSGIFLFNTYNSNSKQVREEENPEVPLSFCWSYKHAHEEISDHNNIITGCEFKCTFTNVLIDIFKYSTTYHGWIRLNEEKQGKHQAQVHGGDIKWAKRGAWQVLLQERNFILCCGKHNYDCDLWTCNKKLIEKCKCIACIFSRSVIRFPFY